MAPRTSQGQTSREPLSRLRVAPGDFLQRRARVVDSARASTSCGGRRLPGAGALRARNTARSLAVAQGTSPAQSVGQMRTLLGYPTIELRLGPDVVLVPAEDVERFHDVDAARRFLSQADAGAASSLRDLTGARSFGDLDEDAVLDAAAEMLASGRYVVLRTQRSYGSAQRPNGREDDDWSNIPRLSELPPSSTEEPSWIEIECIGVAGGSFAGGSVRIELPDGQAIERRLDGQSRIRIDRIPTDGTCKLEVVRGTRVRGTIPLASRPAGLAGEIPMRPGGPARPLRTRAQHVVLVEEPHAFSC
jgi:hypothetical protein